MKRNSFKRRLAALRKRLGDRPQDTAWIIQPENRRYLSGFRAQDTLLTESSGSLVITRREARLLTDSRYTLEAEREAPDFRVVTLKKGLAEGLPGIVSGLGTKHLGFEETYVTWEMHHQILIRLRAISPRIHLSALNGVVESMREVKDQEEVRAMESASDLMCRILSEVIAGLKPGRTERETAWQIQRLAHEAGADGLAFPSIVASGPNSALPHATPTDRRIRQGEPVTLDVGLRIDGYCCDMTRTVFLGKVKPPFKRIYQTVLKAQEAALDRIRPGVESTFPDAVAREIIKEAGYGAYFGHALGHGVGLAAHESPRLGPEKPVRLQAGMVVTVEPGIYVPGKGGVRLEQMVVIEKDGPRILTGNNHLYDF